jgi:BirA family biotin operon repressor/biotin-[acetyl-CoA-carboxylase] ligase
VDATAVYSLASLATRDAVQDVSGLRVSIKWPNDILIAGRKLAGILAEGLSAGVIVGIGINTNLDEDRLGTIGPEATSLSNETSADVDHEGLLERLVVRLEEYYQNAASAPGRLFEDWKRSLVTLGQSVEVETATESWIGVAVDVAVDGSLLVLNDKRLVRVYAGDVRIRPA